MLRKEKTMNLYFCKRLNSGQIYNGKQDYGAMYEHIIAQKLLYCCNGSLYFYYHEEGRYIQIEKQNEWHVISSLLSEKLRKAIRPKYADEMVRRVKNTASIQIHIDEFNYNSDLINVRNGVLNYKTKELLAKSPEYKFTYQLNVSYIQDKDKLKAPYFFKFCETSLDDNEQKRKLLLEIISYLCTPLMNAKKCFIFLGEPNSGKSLMVHLIEFIFGKELISNIQLENLGNRFSSGVLSSKRLNVCAELSAHPLKNIELFKLIVGGDTLSGEFKGRDVFQFENRCKLLYAGNILPPVKNEDISTAFVDRLTVLKFSHSIPREERIYNLDEKLKEEANVIFTFAMDTINALIDNNFEFELPKDSEDLLRDYSFQQTNIDTFINEWCELDESFKTHSSVLYAFYKRFCTENAIQPISQNLFSQKIGSVKGVSNGRFRLDGGNPIRGFYGIAVKEIYVQDSEK